jgi:hypothetical protein
MNYAGVCCTCQQSNIPVYWEPEELAYVCKPHKFMGIDQWCEGADMVPQVVFNEKGESISSDDSDFDGEEFYYNYKR